MENKLPTLPHEIGAPVDYLPPTPWWVWGLAGLVMIILLVALVWLGMKFLSSQKTSNRIPEQDPYREAYREIQDLEKESASLPFAHFATGLSLILRKALSEILNDSALYETNEELAQRALHNKEIPVKLRELLTDLGQAKYAPSDHKKEESREVAQRALQALQAWQETRTQGEQK
jgi:hypothetical protein